MIIGLIIHPRLFSSPPDIVVTSAKHAEIIVRSSSLERLRYEDPKSHKSGERKNQELISTKPENRINEPWINKKKEKSSFFLFACILANRGITKLENSVDKKLTKTASRLNAPIWAMLDELLNRESTQTVIWLEKL